MFGTKGSKGGRPTGMNSNTSQSSKQDSQKGTTRPISCKKRKLSDSN